MSLTILDIARYARVSKSTVSRVLNGDPHVSKAASDRVREAMKVLDYKPNAAARSLVLKKSNSFSMIVQDIRNPYYAHASWIAERFFHQNGYGLVIHNADNDLQLEREILDTIRYRGVDGVLSIGGNRNVTNIVDFHVRGKLPLVLVDREVPGYDVPAINLNNQLGGKLATDHLLDLGHQSIVFATSDFTVQEMHRGEGYLDAMRERGLAVSSDFMISQSEGLWSVGKCPKLSELIETGKAPTAIFASNDIKALQVMRVLKEHGLRVPEDVSVVGYDDVPLVSLMVPSLTTIHQPSEHMVEAGARLLLDIANGRAVEITQQLFEPWLIERESTVRIHAKERTKKKAGASI